MVPRLTGWICIIMAASGAALDVPVLTQQPNGDRLKYRCAECTTVADGVYTIVDELGAPTVQLPCGVSAVTKAFCASGSVRPMSMVIPDAADVCQRRQESVRCIDTNAAPVAVWGDVRLDRTQQMVPPHTLSAELQAYSSGLAQDLGGTDSDVLFSRGSGIEGANVYAYNGNNPIKALMGWYAGGGVPSGGTYTSTVLPVWTHLNQPIRMEPGSYDIKSFPEYANSAERLFLYFGYDNNATVTSHVGSCLEYPEIGRDGSDPNCLTVALYRYLSTHRKVRLVDARGLATATFITKTPTSEATLSYYRSMKASSGCGKSCASDAASLGSHLTTGCAADCWTDMRVANSKLFAQPISLWADLVAWEHRLIPTNYVSPPNGYSLMYRLFADATGQQLRYPMFVLPQPCLNIVRLRGILTWVEESVDLSKWTVHPESLPSTVIRAIEAEAWLDVGRFLVTVSLLTWQTPAAAKDLGYYNKVYACTGNNVYLRIVNYKGRDAYGGGIVSTTEMEFLWPATVMHAEETGTVQLLVTPSLAPISYAPSTTAAEVCKEVAGCIFLPAAYAYYPADGFFVHAGSTKMRSFMHTQVMPLLYESCDAIVADPVRFFLLAPSALRAKRCYRVNGDRQRRTCYTWAADRPDVGPSAVVQTDALRTYVSYSVGRYAMTVTTEEATVLYPVPLYLLGGPFTPHDIAPLAYVYDVPVVGALRVGDLYVSAQESCDFAATVPSAPEASGGCNCTDYPLFGDRCLCREPPLRWALTQGGLPPAGVTFTYPFFFRVHKLATAFAVVNKQMAFDEELYTGVDIDCPYYLCQGSASCMDTLQTSNYMVFCENQKTLLATTLEAILDSKSAVGSAVERYLSQAATPPSVFTAPDKSLPLANVPPRAAGAANPWNPAVDAIKLYYQRFSQTLPPPMSTAYPEGYNYREPYTGPWAAFGMSIVPSIGLGILTEKVNMLAARQLAIDTYMSSVMQYASHVGSEVNKLAVGIEQGMKALVEAVSGTAQAHNALVQQVNTNFAHQTGFNRGVAASLSGVNDQLSAGTVSVNMLSVVSARAATLGIRTASIMTGALNQASKARDFRALVAACSAYTPLSAQECAQSPDGLLLSTAVQRHGTVVVLDSLVLEPTNYVYMYGTPEFCHNNVHYAVTSPAFIFVLVEGRMLLSSTSRWAPEEIGPGVNVVTTPRCPHAHLVVQDLTPGVPVVDLSTDAVPGPASLGQLLQLVQPVLQVGTVDPVSTAGEIAGLSSLTGRIDDLLSTKLTKPVLANSTLSALAAVDVVALGSIVMASGAILLTVYLTFTW